MKPTLKIIPVVITIFLFASCKENTNKSNSKTEVHKKENTVTTDVSGVNWACAYAGKNADKTIQFFKETLGFYLHKNTDYAAVFLQQ